MSEEPKPDESEHVYVSTDPEQRRHSPSTPPTPTTQAQLSNLARSVILNNFAASTAMAGPPAAANNNINTNARDSGLMPPPKTVVGRALGTDPRGPSTHAAHADGVGKALTDTPVPTAPPSPQIGPKSHASGTSTPATKTRATTLDIPGLTKSKVSPDGRIAERDVGSKLVVVMVGLPARGKSYVTKKLARYLNWMQHSTKIFNVGQRRRVFHAENTGPRDSATSDTIEHQLRDSVREIATGGGGTNKPNDEHDVLPPPALSTTILVNGEPAAQSPDGQPTNPSPMTDVGGTPSGQGEAEPPAADKQSLANSSTERKGSEDLVDGDRSRSIDQPASFFDPHNQEALNIREQVALATLDELLDYILDQGGSVGILDATNSTPERRAAIIDHIRKRAGLDLNVLFLESECHDENLLQANMRLKLSGPDYRGKDPELALADFKARVELYQESYVPLGKYEEDNNLPYLKLIDVSRKLVSHQVNGFLSSQVVYYLLNFNLSPRQIWITRHGESLDDVKGRIGGDADLSENGIRYAKALTAFMEHQWDEWQDYQRRKSQSIHFPPMPGDSTPPNPQYASQTSIIQNYCVWTSMFQRTKQTVQYFDDEVYDVKEMRMLDEMSLGRMDGMTHAEVLKKFPEEYARRQKSKLHYHYPGSGGEGYLDMINRLKAVIVEIERMTDHVLIVTHRSVARVLLSYFLGLQQEDITDLEIPLGVLYCLEPKTYGVEFKMYRYDPQKNDFYRWGNENLHRQPVD